MTNQEFSKLKETHRDIIKLAAVGQTNKQIAEALGLSEKCIKYHKTNIYKKTSTKNMLELVNKIVLLYNLDLDAALKCDMYKSAQALKREARSRKEIKANVIQRRNTEVFRVSDIILPTGR